MSTKTILYVDDEYPLRDVMTSLFQEHGFNIVTAYNGQVAIEICNQTAIDLVITDLDMPVMNGVDLLVYLRRHFPDIPLFVLSGASHLSSVNKKLIEDYCGKYVYQKPTGVRQVILDVKRLFGQP